MQRGRRVRKVVYSTESRGYKLPPQAERAFAAPDLIPGSSAVEQPAVNRLVAGSNPARGANYFRGLGGNRLTP